MEDLEFNRASPGTEFSPPPAEFSGGGAPEFAPLPPEYGQGSGSNENKQKKRRKWKQLVAAVLTGVVGMTVFFGAKQTPPQAEPVPSEDVAAGPVELMVRYAELQNGAVHYSYYPFLLDPNDPEKMSGDIPLPIDVYARVTDENGGSAAPARDPDQWIHSRGYDDYVIDAKGLQGDLTLTLTALYTQDGTAKKTERSIPVALPEAESPTLDISYAVTDGEKISFGYDLLVPDADLPTGEQQYWPITVYVTAQSEDGETYYGDTEVWDSSRASLTEREILLWEGVDTSALTLKLTAEYAHNGETHTIFAERPVEQQIPEETTQPPVDFSLEGAAELYIMKEEPEVAYGFFNGHLKLTEGDEAALDLVPEVFTVNWYDEAGNLLGSDQATDLGELAESYGTQPGTLPEMKADPEGGWRFPYDGFFNIAGRPEAAAAYSVALQVRDQNTGYTTTVESNQIGETTYPLGSGQIVVTVYNDTDSWTIPSIEGAPDNGLTVLYYGTFDEADFTELPLPKPQSPDPLKAFPSGQFVHYGNQFDNGANQMTDAEPFVFPIHEYDTEGNALLTRRDVALIPPSADGNRYVNVHTAWQSSDDPCLILDSPETDQHWEYNPYVFTYSEGYAYIDAYGMPWKEGLWFVGWFDDEGNQVHLLSYMDHCDRIPGVEGMDGIDWRSFHTITLHAVFVEE